MVQAAIANPEIPEPAEGSRIGTRGAARSYGIGASTITDWKRRGWITVGDDGLMDEVELVRLLNNHPGKRGPKPHLKLL
jgi:hypothetical protein